MQSQLSGVDAVLGLPAEGVESVDGLGVVVPTKGI